MYSILKSSILGVVVFASILVVAFGLITSKTANALVITHNECIWPTGWPKVLDEVSGACRTIEVAASNQENIYEIFVTNRDVFEKLWPFIVSVKTTGAPIRLRGIGVHTDSSFLMDGQPTVRIYALAYSGLACMSLAENGDHNYEALTKQGRCLRPASPWPTSIIGPNGELPEYVQVSHEVGYMTWIPADRESGLSKGFLHRARIEIELVVDGHVIDLNRVPFPENSPILDKRFAGEKRQLLNDP
jgi:hypothetical protein